MADRKRRGASPQNDPKIEAGAEQDDAALQAQLADIADSQRADVQRPSQCIGEYHADGDRDHRGAHNRGVAPCRYSERRDRDAQQKPGGESGPVRCRDAWCGRNCKLLLKRHGASFS